jgi:hypothetical protein
MPLEPELARLAGDPSAVQPPDPSALARAGGDLHFDWPRDYLDFMNACDGGDWDLGEFPLQVWPARDLVATNRAQQEAVESRPIPVDALPEWMRRRGGIWVSAPESAEEMRPGLVFFGSNLCGEYLAYDRTTRDVLLVPCIGDDDDAIFLGHTLAEAVRKLSRGEVFKDPIYPRRGPSWRALEVSF